MRLLLLSNSTNYGQPYLSHALDEVLNFLDGTTLTFVPFANADYDGYVETVRTALEPVGVNVTSVHEVSDPHQLVRESSNIFVGGGNTFLLVKTLQDTGLLETISECVAAGLNYMGASAGTNIAAPTLRTTNDMPIVEPDSFSALNLLPFQINPHFLDADPGLKHNGETRLTRLLEFTTHNDVRVLGLREGTWLRVENETAVIGGQSASPFSTEPAVLLNGTELTEVAGDVSYLLEEQPRFDT